MERPALTTREVMERLNVRDPDTVYALQKAGKIRGAQLGRVWRFDPDSVDAFLRGETTQPTVGELARAVTPRRPAARPVGSWAAGAERIIRRRAGASGRGD